MPLLKGAYNHDGTGSTNYEFQYTQFAGSDDSDADGPLSGSLPDELPDPTEVLPDDLGDSTGALLALALAAVLIMVIR